MHKLFFCECSCSALAVDPDLWAGDDEICVSMWQNGRAQPPLKSRLTHVWHIVRHDHPWTDEVILSRESVTALVDTLEEWLKCPAAGHLNGDS